ncbi:MAG: hypothetical protein AMJ53_09420 [Gammaproteobacteria bacterium SG8_11]|nr:MAG: hypothetical protein AMJ53_09420 [Gammaproteobacteria bacterium SG8_11]
MPNFTHSSSDPRITAIDTLRGFAVLGILLINIQGFAMISAAYVNPAAYGELTGWNYAVWFGSYLLADSKFLALFSLLFGASLMLIQQHTQAQSADTVWIYQIRRLSILFVIGMLHAYFIWPGDILVAYALCGVVLLMLVHWPSRHLLITALIVISLPSLHMLQVTADMQFWDEAEWEQAQREWRPPKQDYQREIQAYQGSWAEQQQQRVSEAFNMQTETLPGWLLWRAGGLMLLGMVLFKLGILNAGKPPGFYRWMAVMGLGLGLPLVAFSELRMTGEQWSLEFFTRWGYQINYWASLLVAGGYIGLVMRLCQLPAFAWLTRPLAAVGRMALSNYLLQSLLCTWVFYGHGLGLFGKVERVAQLLIVFAAWIVLIIFSQLWLRRFRYGPVEWLWRSASHFRWQPLRAA